MPRFLAILLHCVLVLGLGFIPVANALDMAAMAGTQPPDTSAATPPCHAPEHAPQKSDKCCGSGHCHCAMANALPTSCAVTVQPFAATGHPQTVHHLALGHAVVPDTPPPRAMP